MLFSVCMSKLKQLTEKLRSQRVKVNETRENYDAVMHGYTFLLLTPFSFVKLLWKNDWWVATVLKNIESAPGKPFLKVHNPTTSHPFPTSLQKSWIGPRTLKTAPRALDISGNYWIKRKQNLITKKNSEMKRIRRYNLNLSHSKNTI